MKSESMMRTINWGIREGFGDMGKQKSQAEDLPRKEAEA